MRFSKQVDRSTQKAVAWHIRSYSYGRGADHTFEGFSTGVWTGNTKAVALGGTVSAEHGLGKNGTYWSCSTRPSTWSRYGGEAAARPRKFAGAGVLFGNRNYEQRWSSTPNPVRAFG